MVLCTAGNRSGLRCTHKRNMGDGITMCAINANAKLCSFAISDEEHLKRQKAKLDEIKGGK